MHMICNAVFANRSAIYFQQRFIFPNTELYGNKSTHFHLMSPMYEKYFEFP